MERINDLPICVGEVVCKMNFMVVDIDRYDILLGLDVFIKIGVVVDIERQFIQVCHGLNADVHVWPLNMINMFQRMNNYFVSKFQEVQIRDK
jgi:hypothetical protein